MCSFVGYCCCCVCTCDDVKSVLVVCIASYNRKDDDDKDSDTKRLRDVSNLSTHTNISSSSSSSSTIDENHHGIHEPFSHITLPYKLRERERERTYHQSNPPQSTSFFKLQTPKTIFSSETAYMCTLYHKLAYYTGDSYCEIGLCE